MDTKFVKVLADVHVDWEGLPPTYRVYVNRELFAERTWIWTDSYLEEALQIQGPPGDYHVLYELVPPYLAQMRVENLRVALGPATTIGNDQVRINP